MPKQKKVCMSICVFIPLIIVIIAVAVSINKNDNLKFDESTAEAITNENSKHRLQWWLNDIGWDNERSDITGKGVRIALIDSGVDLSHPDIKESVEKNLRVSCLTSNRTDTNSHGTAAAAVISGRNRNTNGILGIAVDATIISIDVTDEANGIVEESALIEGISKAFGAEVSEFDKSDVYLGTYVQSYGGEYMITPVTADIINCDNSKTDLNKIKAGINPNEIYTEVQNDISDLEIFDNLSGNEKIKLQTSTAIGNSFADASVFKYFYKKGSSNGTGTEYKYSTADSISGWAKLGSIKILGYAIKVKTVKNKTYDNVYSVVTASGLSNKFVHYYTYNMKATSANTEILDETYLNGDSQSKVTTTIGTNVSSDGKSTITTQTSYSYNPNGQRIINSFGERYVKTWTADPNSKVKNASWKINPSILVSNSNGKNNNTSIYLYVSAFRVGGGIRHYTIDNKAGVVLKFKNHKKV